MKSDKLGEMWQEAPLSRMKGVLREELSEGGEGKAERAVEGQTGKGSERARQAWYSYTGESGISAINEEGVVGTDEGSFC